MTAATWRDRLVEAYKEHVVLGYPCLNYWDMANFLKFKGVCEFVHFVGCNAVDDDFNHFQNYARQLGGIAYTIHPDGGDYIFFDRDDLDLTAFLLSGEAEWHG
jgi:hypothetical protein